MGVTLAELMVITLFVLLLLLQETKSTSKDFDSVASLEEANRLVEALVESGSEIEISETWRILTRTVRILSAKPNLLDNWLRDLESQASSSPASHWENIASLEKELRTTKSLLEDERSRNTSAKHQVGLLRTELINAKAGGMVICTYEPPANIQTELRGPSLPIGTLHIEADGITLVQKNEMFRTTHAVDFLGELYDRDSVLTLLDEWPLNKKLSFNEYSELGRRFVALSEEGSQDIQDCRFSMDYYIEDSTPLSVFTDRFERYFLRQTRINANELETRSLQ